MRRVTAFVLLAAAILPACGDDDDDDLETSSGGWGWIRIESPSAEGWASTAAESVNLGGSAFIRSENGGPTADVTWWNFSTGQSGPASSHFDYDWVCFLWYCAWGEVSHTWNASIPLASGENVIQVEARTNDFNWARAIIRVMRVPDTTPPLLWISTPTADPTLSVTASTVTLGGSASDDVAVASVLATNETSGASAVASGTTLWTVDVALNPGLNVIRVTAMDPSGRSGSDWIEVTCAPLESPTGGIPIPERFKTLFGRYDANKDGKLDDDFDEAAARAPGPGETGGAQEAMTPGKSRRSTRPYGEKL
jgi:hypothetical protein